MTLAGLLAYVVQIERVQLDLMPWIMEQLTPENGSVAGILSKLAPRQWIKFFHRQHIFELKDLLKSAVIACADRERLVVLSRSGAGRGFGVGKHGHGGADGASLSTEQAYTVVGHCVELVDALTALDNGDIYMQGHILSLGADSCGTLLETIQMIWPVQPKTLSRLGLCGACS